MALEARQHDECRWLRTPRPVATPALAHPVRRNESMLTYRRKREGSSLGARRWS